MVGKHDNVIFYKEDGDDALQVESNLTEEGNFNIIVREEVSGTGLAENVYAGILLSRSGALELIASLSTALAKTV